MAKEKSEQKVRVETLTQIGLPSRQGYVPKGEEMEVSLEEFAKHPETYALLKEPSKKLSEKVGEIQEREGVEEKSSLMEDDRHTQTVAVAPEYETDPVAYDEHMAELEERTKKKGGKK